MIETLSDEDKATLTGLVKVLKQLQDLCGLTGVGSALAGVISLCGGGLGMAQGEGAALVAAVLAFAAAPIFFVSAYFVMQGARGLLTGLREGSEQMRRRLRRTLLASIPPAIAAVATVGVLLWFLVILGQPQVVVLLIYFGAYTLGGSAVPAITLFVAIRYGPFIDGVLFEPIPRRTYPEDAFDEFVAKARGRKGKPPRKTFVRKARPVTPAQANGGARAAGPPPEPADAEAREWVRDRPAEDDEGATDG